MYCLNDETHYVQAFTKMLQGVHGVTVLIEGRNLRRAFRRLNKDVQMRRKIARALWGRPDITKLHLPPWGTFELDREDMPHGQG